MSQKKDKPIFKPYSDVYWDRNRHGYNIFGMNITPELLHEIANGYLNTGYASFDLKYDKEDKGYTVTSLTGLKAKLERLLEEPIDNSIQGENELMEYVTKCFREFIEKDHGEIK